MYLCGAKDPNYKLTAPSVKPDYLISTGKPYIKWAAVAGASKYEVYRSGSKSGTYQYIGTATKLNYTDTTAKPGYYYYYKVRAVNASGVKSSYSAAVSALCHCARPELNGAQYLSSSGKPYLSWGAVTGAGKYYVYRAGSQNGSYKYIGSTTKTIHRYHSFRRLHLLLQGRSCQQGAERRQLRQQQGPGRQQPLRKTRGEAGLSGLHRQALSEVGAPSPEPASTRYTGPGARTVPIGGSAAPRRPITPTPQPAPVMRITTRSRPSAM